MGLRPKIPSRTCFQGQEGQDALLQIVGPVGPAQVVLLRIDDLIAFIVHENTSDAVFAHPKAKLFGIGTVGVIPARGKAFVELTSPRTALALGALDLKTTCVLGQRLVVIGELREAGGIARGDP